MSAFSDADLDLILDALRAGEVVHESSSGGRYATTVAFRDDQFVVETFEEGVTDTYRRTDAEMRTFIVRDPAVEVWLRVLTAARAARHR